MPRICFKTILLALAAITMTVLTPPSPAMAANGKVVHLENRNAMKLKRQKNQLPAGRESFEQKSITEVAATNRVKDKNSRKLDPKEMRRLAERRIAEQRRKIERLQEGILEHKMKILHSKEKERDLQKELADIDTQLRKQHQKLAELHRHQEGKKVQYDNKLIELRQATAERDAYRRHVQERLAAFYRMGSIGVINVAFSSERLPDLLNFQEYFQNLVQYDRSAIRSFQDTIVRLSTAKDDLNREQRELVSVIEEVKDEEDRLAATQQSKEALLDLANTEHQLYLNAVAQIEGAAGDLAASLQELQAEAARLQAAAESPPQTAVQNVKPKPEKKTSDFLSRRGRLTPPVAGVLAVSYGDDKDAIGGIDIKTAAGAEVRAVADGSVILAAFLKEHGNMLIVDHGDQYYTIFSRLGDLRVAEGTRVTSGQVIATVPSSLEGEDSTLHFEIRHGADLEDPLQWLDRTQLDNPPPTSSAKTL